MLYVESLYEKNGVPTNLTPEETAEFAQMIYETAAMLPTAPPSLSPTDIALFRATLCAMYSDVGGDPDTLP